MSENRDVATTTEGPGRALAVPRDSANVIQLILAAARDPTVDAAKVETMANLAIKLQDREMEQEFNRDLNAALMEMPRITKRGSILNKAGQVQSRYSRFEDIDLAVRPILARNNLAIRFELGSDGPMVTARPILSHANGYTSRGDALKMPMDDSGSKNKTQGMGSAASYAKRHAYKAALNIIEDGEDIDGLGSLPDDQLNDVQVRTIAQAEQAVNAGRYQEWFDALDATERAWLVLSGRHDEFGGGPVAVQLPKPRSTAARAKASPAGARPTPEPADAGGDDHATTTGGDASTGDNGGQLALGEEKAKITTPRQWVDRFKADLERIGEVGLLDTYMDGKRDTLERLEKSDATLHEECMAAYRARLADVLEVD